MLTENSEVAQMPGRIWRAERVATNTSGDSPLAIPAQTAIMEFGLPSIVAPMSNVGIGAVLVCGLYDILAVNY